MTPQMSEIFHHPLLSEIPRLLWQSSSRLREGVIPECWGPIRNQKSGAGPSQFPIFSLLRKAADAPSLVAFRARLDVALDNLG